MKKKPAALLLAVFVIFALTSCGGYYQIKDPASDKIYYSRSIDEEDGGAIRFEDEKTGTQVTLQNSEVKEIESKEYRQAVEATE